MIRTIFRSIIFASFGLSSFALAFDGPVVVTITDQAGKPVENVVVTLQPKNLMVKGPVYPEAVMAQRDMEFQPHVLAIKTNTEVKFPNWDVFRHHVYSFSKAKQFEIRLYGGDEEKIVVFDKPGIVAIGCNIHDDMLAYIYVTDAPYVLTSDAQGNVTFPAVVGGDYTIFLWHPRLNKKKSQTTSNLTLDADGATEKIFSLTLKRARKSRRKQY